MRAFAEISSGFSNYFKAQYMWKANEKMSSSGMINDFDTTKTEAIAQLLGFGS